MNVYTTTDLIFLLSKKCAKLHNKQVSTSTEAVYVAAQIELISDIVDELALNNPDVRKNFSRMVDYHRERLSEEAAV